MTAREPPVEPRKAGYRLALVAILLAAVLVRLHDYDAWGANPGVFTFDHEPVLLYSSQQAAGSCQQEQWQSAQGE